MQGASGTVRTVLRLEGLAILTLSILIYAQYGFSWTTFAILFLAPDLSFAGYAVNPRLGAIFYNTAHSLIPALLSITVGILSGNELLLNIGLIWCAHIGFDRALGYGLKYSRGFTYTHLGRIGKLTNTQHIQ